MTFATPTLLYFAGATLVLLTALFWQAGRRREAALAKLGNPALIARLTAGVNWRGRRWRNGLLLAAIVLSMLALARPRWGEDVQEVQRRGVQVMVALDVSQSMLAEDVKPSRLERAKLEIADLMTKLNGDEIGLTLFAGASFIQFPLTSDYGTARSFLDGARPEVISRPGTNIADAVRTALRGFDETSSAQKVIVLITDGEGHEPGALEAVRAAVEDGVIFYAIGFGSPEGVPIPEYDAYGNPAGFKQDRSGQPVLSRLDEATLQEIAAIGNGRYFRATAAGSELDALVQDLARLQEGEIGTQLDVRAIERFQWFLGAALIALTAATVIPERKKRDGLRLLMQRQLFPIILAGLLLAACGDQAATPVNSDSHTATGAAGGAAAGFMARTSPQSALVKQGNVSFANQEYDAALTAYAQAAAEVPELAEPVYNAAGVHYRQGDYGQAEERWSAALAQADESLAARTHYNVGNARFQREQYAPAIEAYKAALRLNPNDQDAKTNLELALQQTQQQEQEQQQQEQGADQSEQEEPQDGDGQQEQDQNQQGDGQQQEEQDQGDNDAQAESQSEQSSAEQERQSESGDQGEDAADGADNDPAQNQSEHSADGQAEADQTEMEQSEERQQSKVEYAGDEAQTEPADSAGQEEPSDELPQPGQAAGGIGEATDEPPTAIGAQAGDQEGLTEDQARQLLIAAGQGTQTLQERLQQIYAFPHVDVEEDW